MSDQEDLFNQANPPFLARKADAPGSHEAAEKLRESGSLSGQRKLVLQLVRDHPSRTSRELARMAEPEDGEAREKLYQVIHRRLPELERFGLIESDRDEPMKSGELIWWARGD